MKKQVAKIASSIVYKVAQKSANTVSDWRYYQPKVPMKLKNK